MMTKQKVNIFILSLLVSVTLYGQNTYQDRHAAPITGDLFIPYFYQYNGTPFLNGDWVLGSVKLVNGGVHHNLKLNYDGYKGDLLYFNVPLQKIVLIDKAIINEFWLVQTDPNIVLHGVRSSLFDKNAPLDEFVFLMVEDTVSLVMKKGMKINLNNLSYYADNKLGKFYEETSYYYTSSAGFHSLPERKKKLAKLFPSCQDEILKYIKTNHLSMKDTRELMLIFKEINRLIKER